MIKKENELKIKTVIVFSEDVDCESVKKIKNDWPDYSIKKIESALKKSNGNIDEAIKILLQSYLLFLNYIIIIKIVFRKLKK
jgi:hypothetical protein